MVAIPNQNNLSNIVILNGIDVLDIKRFKKAVSEGKDKFLQSIFLPTELKSDSLQHLAGIYCAKEAVMKAYSLKNNDWLNIEIKNEESGRPVVFVNKPINYKVVSTSLSISHDNDKAIAAFCALVYTE